MRLGLFILIAFVATVAQAGNRLAGQSSLYLQQHAHQPVDWYPWGEQAFDRAREEGKPIFVSVGYAACHWCHVMAEESFEDEGIAALLNAGFVAIKIDRERRPDLDEQFSLVTTLLTGTSGWPNSVFLTPDGDPIFAGGYFPPQDFRKVLEAVADTWANDRENAASFAKATRLRMQRYLDRTAALGDVSARDIAAATRAAIGDLDVFNGGFGTAPKFPVESLLLLLLDQAERHGDTTLLRAATLTLDGMLRGGIHDHVGGGFHRYAIDPEWTVPHFEKMLYNQALIGRALLRAYVLTGEPDYARAARRTFDYVLRDMRAPDGAFYAAQDADTVSSSGEREEGRFYLWTSTDIDRAVGADARQVAAALNIDGGVMIEGRSIVHLDQSPADTAALLGVTVQRFDGWLEELRRYRSTRTAPIRDEKIILSWNAEMIATLAEAASVLDTSIYLDAAAGAARFLLQAMRTEEGFDRIHFDGRSDVPAQLTDLAALGNALIALHDHGAEGPWLPEAEALAALMLNRFSDAGQAMRMTHKAQGLGPFRPLDDTELPSGNAQALAFLAGLDRRLARLSEAPAVLAAATAGHAVKLPRQRAGLLMAIGTSRDGPSGPMRVSPGGAVHVLLRPDRGAGQVHFDIRLQDGWHINAHKPLQDYLIGMALTVDASPLPDDAYPASVTRMLGFSEKPLALYERSFRLTAPLRYPENGPAEAALTLQACNDEICLPPADMLFHLWNGSPESDGG